MRPRIQTVTHFCQDKSCRRPITRRTSESPSKYNFRLYCSRTCISRNTPRSPRPKRYFPNGSPLVARMAHDLYFVGRLKQHEIGRIFGLRQHSVSRIVSGQSWGVR